MIWTILLAGMCIVYLVAGAIVGVLIVRDSRRCLRNRTGDEGDLLTVRHKGRVIWGSVAIWLPALLVAFWSALRAREEAEDDE